MTPRIVILLGAPGAGKGTQAVRLAGELALPHVSTGDLLRENLANGTALGHRAQPFMDSGKLVPDDLVLDMLFDRVARPDCRNGYLLDGFPRTTVQADALERKLPRGWQVRVVDIDVPDEELVARVAGRLSCPTGGHTHHEKFAPPARPGICDACGGKLVKRADDDPSVVRKRLEVYRSQTAPLIEYYQSRGLLTRIDGNRGPNEVFEELTQALGVRA